MQHLQRSRTAEVPAVMRALHQVLDDDPKILIDPISPRLIHSGDDKGWLTSLLSHPFAKQWRAGFVLRARYAEDALAEAVQRGVRQYLLLGAGLDTFAYRQPPWASSLRIYEIDHPSTQGSKKEKLKSANIVIPANLRFVPINFEQASIAEALRVTDFSFDRPALCSCTGVIQYLTQDAIDATFQFVASLPASSEIVFSFILPEASVPGVEADALALAAQRASELGEPWLTRCHPDEFAVYLRSAGFLQVIHLTPEEAHRRYFRDRRDGLRERHGEQLMRAIV